MKSGKRNCSIQICGICSKEIYHYKSLNPNSTGEYIQKRSNKKKSSCNEFKFSCCSIFLWKSLQLTTLSSERAQNFSGRKSNCFSRYFFSFSPYVTTMKAMQLHGIFHAHLMENFQRRRLLVFDLSSLQNAAEQLNYPELREESLRREMFFQFFLEQVTEVLEEKLLNVQFDKFGTFAKVF